MALDWSALKAAMHAWFVAGSGLDAGKVIWANQATPRPAPPYAMLNPRLALVRVGREELRLTETPGQVEVRQHYRLTVSCHAFGAGALEAMRGAQLALNRPSVMATFREVKLALLDEGQIRDLTALLETAWQERAQMDVGFGLADSVMDTPGWVESVLMTGEVDTDGDGVAEVETTGTITI